MKFNINNFVNIRSDRSKIVDFQDLDHIDGVSISAVTAGLYKIKRDEVVLFYFRDGANYASVFTQSKLISENLKWNKKIKAKKVYALLINTRNANALTGSEGYDALKKISLDLSSKLTKIQERDEEAPKRISPHEILFGCTGTIGEKFPLEKIKNSLPELVNKIKYTQNKLIWMKAAMGIITTDLKPKVAMAETRIGSSKIKIYGIAKGSGMIYPNMATTLGYIFTFDEPILVSVIATFGFKSVVIIPIAAFIQINLFCVYFIFSTNSINDDLIFSNGNFSPIVPVQPKRISFDEIVFGNSSSLF